MLCSFLSPCAQSPSEEILSHLSCRTTGYPDEFNKMLVIYLGPDPVEHMLNYNQDVQPVDFKGTIPPV